MAVTKILARKGRLDVGVRYVLNGDKTQEQILTARLNCEPDREVRQMLETKRDYGKEDGVQYYHMIQSFRPSEITPELALEIAKEFASEHLPGYQTVIGVHVDKEHIHAHILFNSVNADTGEKYHSNAQSYYRQIRDISDRLCREHGLSVIAGGTLQSGELHRMAPPVQGSAHFPQSAGGGFAGGHPGRKRSGALLPAHGAQGL